MSDLQKAKQIQKSSKDGYETKINGKYLYSNYDPDNYIDINNKEIYGRYFHYTLNSSKFVRHFKVNTDNSGSAPTLAALYGKNENLGKWQIIKAINNTHMDQVIEVYPLKSFKEYAFFILEIEKRGSHNVTSVDIDGKQLIDPVEKHHAHFEHFTGIKKNVSFDESKNQVFKPNNERKYSKWMIPSTLAILLTSLLYKKIKL